jgi:formylglycine-generating enzyme required for sulfatase activity
MPIHDMIHIPGGPFLMGSNVRLDEKPIQRFDLPEYWISRGMTTNRQFELFVNETGYVTQAEKENWAYTFDDRQWGEIPGADWRHPEGPHRNLTGRMDFPVLNVSWHDAFAYCAWLSAKEGAPHRLPTEPQWEKAARGGLLLADGTPNAVPDRQYPWGNRPPDDDRCNFDLNVGTRTEVGHYSPVADSPYGCQDMAGNAWEWCHNIYTAYPYDAGDGREDDTGGSNRSVRGGSWHEDMWVSRCPGRGRTSADFRDCYLSFRPVRLA